MTISSPHQTGNETRLACRTNTLQTTTSGHAPSHLQANLLVLPSRHAPSFRALCTRNPVPCPLLAESATPGSFSTLKSHIPGLSGDQIAADIDIRTDAPAYTIYRDGELVEYTSDLIAEWKEDHVAFLIGCSFSFEDALAMRGVVPRHMVTRRTVPMYRTTVPLCAAGEFRESTVVVSMRPYLAEEVEVVRDVTRRFGLTHGEPIAWGWEAVKRLGIEDIAAPEWGDVPLTVDGRVWGEGVDGTEPVFWGCGVTPQEAVMRAGLEGVIMGHKPGHMIVLDVTDEQVFGASEGK